MYLSDRGGKKEASGKRGPVFKTETLRESGAERA